MSKTKSETKIIVLKSNITEAQASDKVERHKTGEFTSLFRRPKKEEIHMHSLKLYYEAILMISGSYTANYFRKATHQISVDYNVKEAVFGDGVFPIKNKSGFEKMLSGKRGKNKIDLRLEEHVFHDTKDTLYFDHHGKETKFPYKINSKTTENYPKRVLDIASPNVKKPEITLDAAKDKLAMKLKKPLDAETRNLKEKLVINEIAEIYVPIYEARLIGPKRKVGIVRIDAVRDKKL